MGVGFTCTSTSLTTKSFMQVEQSATTQYSVSRAEGHESSLKPAPADSSVHTPAKHMVYVAHSNEAGSESKGG